MNKYPLWKYLLILAILVLGALYALPNLYGEDPAIQVSSTRSGSVDAATLARIELMLKQAGLAYSDATRDERGVKIRFPDADTQLKARDEVSRGLGDNYTVALNLMPATPAWLTWISAKPMYLGLDLRGGVHFLMQVDMPAVIKKAEQNYADDARRLMQDKGIRYLTVARSESGGLEIRFREPAERDKALAALRDGLTELSFREDARGAEYALLGQMTDKALAERSQFALEQNITALRNRINELGVSEPVVQQQGGGRIVVQLPGVQDPAKAKKILGQTATLEIMMVDDEHDLGAALSGQVPPGSKLYTMRGRQGGVGEPILLKSRVIYSGDNIIDAAAGFDGQSGGPVVHITLDARGAAINQRVSGENIGKRMAVVYVELKSEPRKDASGKPVVDERGQPVMTTRRVEEVITAPVIKDQLGKRFQITGMDSVEEARDLALLLRAGALYAPIQIVEERTVGPSLGKENIEQGVKATLIGFLAVAIFMIVYYRAFGLIANLGLLLNGVLLVAVLSMIQATLTLPGIAGILLTIGMAVDANVLIYERIREELRNGNTPQASIHAGFEKAFATIADANITTLIAAIMLFNFGSGPIKGFAITLSIGILTSMFTAVMVTRAVANLAFGGRRLSRLWI